MDILFLCTGNTCRSPMAEAIARDVFTKKGWKVRVSSAGTAAPAGHEASKNALLAMENMGLSIAGHSARQATEEILSAADLILTMGESHKLQALAVSPACKPRLFTLHEMARDGLTDVSDPYAMDLDTYENCAKEIEQAIQTIANAGDIVAVASDHGGYGLKSHIVSHLRREGLRFIDLGADNENAVDYPDYAAKLVSAIQDGVCNRGVLVCGTGVGISIAANRVKGIRCALCHDVFSAKAARSHNDANVLAMGGRVIGPGAALETLDAFLKTNFSGDERHAKRIALIDEND